MTTPAKEMEKPACTDFIVAAIRALRPPKARPKNGAYTGLRLHELYRVTTQAYDDREFREAIKELASKQTILISVIVSEIENKQERNRYTKLLNELPEGAALIEPEWKIDDDGMATKPGAEHRFKEFDVVHVYVKEDGVPRKIINLLEGSKRISAITAESIIAEMRKPTAKSIIKGMKKPDPKKK